MDSTQLKRIDQLKLSLNILAGLNPENAEFCIQLASTVNNLKMDFSEMRNVLEEQKNFIEKMKKCDEKLDGINAHLDYIESNFPEVPEEQPRNFYVDVPQILPKNKNNDYQATAVSYTPAVNPTPAAASNSVVKKKAPSLQIPEIRHISVQELNSVQSYMRGRLTVETINMFIDSMNSVLKKKYTTLKMPRSRLKSFDADLYDKWKMTERKAALGPELLFNRDTGMS